LSQLFNDRISQLINSHQQKSFGHGLRGIEKESLRITRDGKISQAPHPAGLGSALTHPYITTDYSEALMEFITPPFTDSRSATSFLRDIHQSVYDNLGDELLLAASMPCAIRGDSSIPIADYGTSNIGKMKHIYRRGLGYRYGRAMQTISGVHFNYSVPEGFWPIFQDLEKNRLSGSEFISASYFAMIRNSLRFGWLILYLFGASPAICKSFLKDRTTLYQDFTEFDPFTLYKPFATSLRMSDIGYKNSNQSQLNISYNNLKDYIHSLTQAIETPYPDYKNIGVDPDGEYRQLNENILQIENEYYSTVRPKQIAHSGEKPTLALKSRGVRYVEIRSLDIDIFQDIGINPDTLYFLEAWMLTCLFHESPSIGEAESDIFNQNFLQVSYNGRDPALVLNRGQSKIKLKDWALEICESMQSVCEILDGSDPEKPYTKSLSTQIRAIHNPELTPSARILSEMSTSNEPFATYAQRISEKYESTFRKKRLEGQRLIDFQAVTHQSVDDQHELEKLNQLPFATFLKNYFDQC